MDVELQQKSPVTHLLKVRFDWDEVVETYEKVAHKLRKNLKLDGFRPGKVPLSIAKRHLAPNIQYEFINQVVNNSYKDALEEKGITEIVDSKVTDIDFKEGKPFEYEIKVEVDPEIKLIDYKKGFPVTQKKYILDKEDIDRYIEEIRENQAEVKEVTEGAQSGHYMICDLQEVDENGIPMVGKKVEDRMIKLGEGVFKESDITNLIGAKAGDEVIATLEPEKGQKVAYKIKVKRVEEHRLPEIDDQWVQDNLESVSSLKEWRQQLEKTMQKEWEQHAEKELQDTIKTYFIDNHDFPVPDARIKLYLDRLVEDLKRRAEQQKQPLDEQEIRTQYRPKAERDIRWLLIEDKLRSQEDIEVSSDEIQAKIEQLIRQYPEDQREAVKNLYRHPEAKSNLKYELLEEKVLAHLRQHANIKTKKVRTKDLRKRSQS